MDDDFNTAGAVAALFDFIRSGNSFLDEQRASEALNSADAAVLEAAIATLTELFAVLGVQLAARATASDLEAEALLAEREEARAARDWERADALRDRLAVLGFSIKDTAQGPHLGRTRD
jgi:cysteinyl-tRNA synthetase